MYYLYVYIYVYMYYVYIYSYVLLIIYYSYILQLQPQIFFRNQALFTASSSASKYHDPDQVEDMISHLFEG